MNNMNFSWIRTAVKDALIGAAIGVAAGIIVPVVWFTIQALLP